MTTRGTNLGGRICAALDVNPLRVERVELCCRANDIARAVVTFLLTDDDVRQILGETADDDS